MTPGVISEIIIDERFKRLLPEMDAHTRAGLEESLLVFGCQNPLFLWQGILIDGHNRFEIIKKHNLPFNIVSLEFDSREEVVVWIIDVQVNRRNLTPMQLSYYRGLHYNTEKIIITNEDGRNQFSEVDGHNDHQPLRQSTAVRLAEVYNISPRTIRRDSELANALDAIGEHSPEAKRKILSGEIEITRKQLREVAAGSENYVSELAESIDNGTFVRRTAGAVEGSGEDSQIDSEQGDLQPLTKMFSQITEDFSSALRNMKADNDVDYVRSALRAYIERLEELYLNLN